MVQLTIDANVINVRQNLDAMNTLERWQSEGKVKLGGAQRLSDEISRHPLQPQATAKIGKMKNIGEPGVWGVSLWSKAKYGANGCVPEYKDLAEVLFPTTPWDQLSQNQQNDVMHLMGHCDSDSEIFVTKDLKDFFDGGRRERLREEFAIVVMTPEEVVAFYENIEVFQDNDSGQITEGTLAPQTEV